MAGGQEKWYFTKDQLQNSPSRKCGLDADKELAYRQQAANLIQDMGQRLQVSQLCINTAIVYMHRFYAFHSFTQFHRNAIAAAALFLAAKVEEQPRKLEYVIKVAHVCLHRGEGVSALTPEQYQEQAQELVFNENVLLQTLGFDVAIDHPHTHVVRTCHLVKAPKDLAQTSYFMASNSLHLTTMCLQYRPTVVACFCIHLASKWSNWAIPQSSEGRHWFSYVDRSVTSDLLERLTAEFLHIFDKCPSRLKRKMMTMSNSGSSPSTALSQAGASGSSSAAPTPDKKQHEEFDKTFDKEYERERRRAPMPGGYVPAPAPQPAPAAPAPAPQKIDYNLYREKRDREERERRQRAQQAERTAERPEARVAEGARSVESRNVDSKAAPRPPVPVQRPHHSHKPHPSWPHKPPHHKPPHEHRHHHRAPPAGPTAGGSGHSAGATAGTSGSGAANPQIPPSTPEMPQRTRPPSLFSPENATPAAAAAQPRPRPPPQPQPQPTPQPHHRHKPEHRPQPPPQEKPLSPKKRPDPTTAIRDMQPPTILSPFSSPPLKEQQSQPQNKPRQRHQSSSEPELVPVVKKLDETPGFENLLRDSQRVSSMKTRPPEIKQERKPDPPPRSLNGIETDPTLVSNLLKESLAKPAPITVATEKKSPVEIKKEITEPPPQPIQPPPQIQPKPEPQPQIQPPTQPQEETSEHSKHKKEKKKKEKHKHKDRDKSKEERKKHKKDKEREKKQETVPQTETGEGALKITIPRDRLSASPGFKIKIPKERLAVPPPPPSSGIKIKISKEVLETSRKRPPVPEPGPPQKMPRHNGQPKVGFNHFNHQNNNFNHQNNNFNHQNHRPMRPNGHVNHQNRPNHHQNFPPPHFQQPLPYYMVQPPPPLYYGLDGYLYGMYGPPPPAPPHQPPRPQPPLPDLPPPEVPPPPPE